MRIVNQRDRRGDRHKVGGPFRRSPVFLRRLRTNSSLAILPLEVADVIGRAVQAIISGADEDEGIGAMGLT